MKSVIRTLLTPVLLAGIFTVTSAFEFNFGKGGKEDFNIQQTAQELEQAIDQRKFADAKEAVNEILPWMKQDIKSDKKTLSQIGKSIDPAELDKKGFASTLNQKNKLYESTKHIVETSPAAIRVKGKDLVKLVNEYVTLIE